MPPHDADDSALLSVAVQAADAAALELVARYGRVHEGVQTKTGPTDLVSEADFAAERAIRSVLSELRPFDAILGEEGGETGDGDVRWLVDPLDGTVNYLFGIPAFAVSVACEDASGTLAGVVVDPLRGECFAATRSGPCVLNGQPFRRPERSNRLDLAMVATGFGYDADARRRQAAVVARVLPHVRDIRRVGAAALDLAWSAYGRFDAFYERGLNPWDMAAGALIAARAGMEVRKLPEVGEEQSGVIVAPPELMEDLLALVVGQR